MLSKIHPQYIILTAVQQDSLAGSLHIYPRPRGRRVQYFVCLCVCYHKIAVKFKLSQILNKLHLTNLVILDKQWFSTRQASSCRQTRFKWRVKLKTKKLTVQILHERLLNQANGSVLLET